MGDLKQGEFILSQCWRLNILNEGGGEAVPPEAPAQCLPCFFQHAEAAGIPWLRAALLPSLPLWSGCPLPFCMSASSHTTFLAEGHW